jgi:anti-sigma factor RsiW
MEHDQIVERLSEYRDGSLGAAEHKAVSRHLTECADCAAFLSDCELLSKVFLRRPAAPTPFQTEAFVARVTARLPGTTSSAFEWLTGRWLVPALGLSFVVLALSFQPDAGQEISDPAAALLIGADRGPFVAVSRPESPGADVFGLEAEER